MMCQSELRGLGAIHEELKQLGVQVLAISVDPPEDARRLSARQSLSFPILCDTKREVVKAYGLLHKEGGPHGSDIAIPAHVLIDQDGRIVSRYVSERSQDRLRPDNVLAAAHRLVR